MLYNQLGRDLFSPLSQIIITEVFLMFLCIIFLGLIVKGLSTFYLKLLNRYKQNSIYLESKNQSKWATYSKLLEKYLF